MLLRISHADDLSEMPSYFRIWQQMMPPKTLALYERLCKSEYGVATSPVSLHVLSTQLGISRTAIVGGLSELEKVGFVNQYEDDDMTNVEVYLPPEPDAETEEIYSTVGAEIARTNRSRATVLIGVWRDQFQQYTGSTWTKWAVDLKLAERLVKNEPDDEKLIKLVKFYWRYMWDRENQTLASFVKNYDSIAARQREMELHG